MSNYSWAKYPYLPNCLHCFYPSLQFIHSRIQYSKREHPASGIRSYHEVALSMLPIRDVVSISRNAGDLLQK